LTKERSNKLDGVSESTRPQDPALHSRGARDMARDIVATDAYRPEPQEDGEAPAARTTSYGRVKTCDAVQRLNANRSLAQTATSSTQIGAKRT
jgi:hypothetical protein